MSVVELTQINYEAYIAIDTTPVLIEFGADWCDQCLTLKPVFEALSIAYQDDVVFCKCNISEQPDIAQLFGISSLPTVSLLHANRLIDQWVGPRGHQTYLDAIEALLATL